MAILVSKADGTVEPFDPGKLRTSLEHAGAAPDMVEQISREVTHELYSGISTSEIYRRAFRHLREHRRGVAARYSLKRAILEFGPSGFPFEAFIGELFRSEGYDVAIDQIIQGACVEHEVDVVRKKGDEIVYIEAKFHNSAGFKTDLKVTLYVKARIDDIRAAAKKGTLARGMVITNTKFSSMALRYASCQGLELLGWDYPQESNLHDRIHQAKLYPITALTSLSRREKTALLSQKKVLCTELARDPEALREAGVRGRHADSVLEEAAALCVPGKEI